MIPAGTSAMRPAFPAPAETLAAWLRGVAPAGTASAGSFIRTAAPAFDEWEAAPVSGAVPMRQAEYLTGRSLARAALASLGCPPSSIPADAERVPVWPMGYLGSISHADGLCIAHVGRTASLTGIGIDFERAGAVPAAIGSDLMSCPEALSLEQEVDDAFDVPTLAFVIKEAFFKAVFPTDRVLFGFTDVVARVSRRTGRFDVRPAAPHLRGMRPGTGRFSRVGTYIIAAAWQGCPG